MEFSTKRLVFPYKQNKHASTQITINNTSQAPLSFKFKASTSSKFIIKPNAGYLEPHQQKTVQITIHRQIIENCANEKIQVIYGENLGAPENFIFKIDKGQAQKQDNINLTMMVEQKQARVKNLEKDVASFEKMPIIKSDEKQKKMNIGVLMLVVLILGILVGMGSPIKIFKRRIVK